MTWWKAAGCACVVACAAIGCFAYSAFLARRLRALDRAKRFAQFVADQIRYYETPFSQIVRRFAAAEKLDGVAAAEKPDVAPGARKLDGAAGENPKSYAAFGLILADGLDETDAARFLSFYEGIGAGFADAELRSCEEARRYFEERCGDLEKEYAVKKRSSAAIAFFAAFSVCVLLW